MAEKFIAEKKTINFNMLVLMGEMKEDHTYFEKAWEQAMANALRL